MKYVWEPRDIQGGRKVHQISLGVMMIVYLPAPGLLKGNVYNLAHLHDGAIMMPEFVSMDQMAEYLTKQNLVPS